MLKNELPLDKTIVSHYLREYERLEPYLSGQPSKPVRRLRRRALQEFGMNGFLSLKQEGWKYTSLESLQKNPFTFSIMENEPAPSLSNRVEKLIGSSTLPLRFIFINGLYAPKLSTSIPPELGSVIRSLSGWMNDHPEETLTTERSLSNNKKRLFSHMNTAFMHDGIYISLEDKIDLKRPIELIYITTRPQHFTPIRNIIKAGKQSKATIIEKYIHLPEQKSLSYFTNAVTHCFLAEGSHIKHLKYLIESNQAIHINLLYAEQQKNSYLDARLLAVSGALLRTDTHIQLLETGAHCDLKGLSYARQHQQVDHYLAIDHQSSHTVSEAFYKAIGQDSSRTTFNGKVIVRKEAVESQSKQYNKNLLLSHNAEVNTAPQLEIFADNIQCLHGASLGQLDEDALFYLCSRGLNPSEARELLIFAFMHDILQYIPLDQGVILPTVFKKSIYLNP